MSGQEAKGAPAAARDGAHVVAPARGKTRLAWRACSRAVRVVARPWVWAVLTALVIADVSSLPSDIVRDGAVSAVGRARAAVARVAWSSLASALGRGGGGGGGGSGDAWLAGTFGGPQMVSVFVARSTGSVTGFEILDPDVESMDRITRLLSTRPMDIAPVSLLATPVRRGAWAATRESHDVFLRVPRGDNGGWSDGDVSRAREELARWLEASPGAALPRIGRAIREGRDERVVWSGYARNVASGAVAAAWAASWAWMLPGSAWRVRRALARGECPRCGYALAGVRAGGVGGKAGTTCPECGRVWTGGGEESDRRGGNGANA
jgi:hypothetical protein